VKQLFSVLSQITRARPRTETSPCSLCVTYGENRHCG